MPTYRYELRQATGALSTGVMEAASLAEATGASARRAATC